MPDHSSLLALDSMAGEKSVRVAVYDRAMLIVETMRNKKASVEEIADQIFAFVAGDKHRLEAFDVSLKRLNPHNKMSNIIDRAEAIAAWADQGPGETSLDDFPEDPPKVTKVVRKKGK